MKIKNFYSLVLLLIVLSSCVASANAKAGTWHVETYGHCVVGKVWLYDINDNKEIWSKHFDCAAGKNHNWNVDIPDSSKYHTLQLRTNWWWNCPDQFQTIYMYDGGDVKTYNNPKNNKISIEYKNHECEGEGPHLVWEP